MGGSTVRKLLISLLLETTWYLVISSIPKQSGIFILEKFEDVPAIIIVFCTFSMRVSRALKGLAAKTVFWGALGKDIVDVYGWVW